VKIMDDRASDFLILREAAEEAARVALGYWGKKIRTTHKPDGTVVSEADLAVDAAISERLKAARPDYGWLSEESGEHERRLGRRRVWTVDPIDGTRAFLQKRDDWTVAAALIDDHAPVLAVVINPVRSEVFHAKRGEGAFLNGKRIAVNGGAKLEGARIIASNGVLKRPIWPEPWPRLTPAFANSLAYRLALVANGRIDAAFALTAKSEWDIAPGALLVAEAGGVAVSARGHPLRFNTPAAKVDGFLAAGADLLQILARRLQGALARLDEGRDKGLT
jgi:myo-inositol-1(or 4)-monophosphatase